ncbi:hypothetical protein [Nocardia niigatensis]|uniref:hypothetical protein n=1 Tax=Nocardia niigatensis TaxID=209249 RepID=UPI0002D585F0|nr:hypothetical protein [Nocardia niigatensis]
MAPNHIIKALLVLVAVLASSNFSFIAAALLKHHSGSWPVALLSGGSTFAASLTLELLIIQNLWPD